MKFQGIAPLWSESMRAISRKSYARAWGKNLTFPRDPQFAAHASPEFSRIESNSTSAR